MARAASPLTSSASLLLVPDAAGEERMIVGGAQPVDDAVVHVDDQQQVGQGVEHGALAAFALFELLHQSAAAHQVLHAMAQQVPVDGLGEEVRGAGLVGLVDRGHVVAARDHHDGQVGAARHARGWPCRRRSRSSTAFPRP